MAATEDSSFHGRHSLWEETKEVGRRGNVASEALPTAVMEESDPCPKGCHASSPR